MAADKGSLIIRRARADDKPAVLEFCSKIWEGWDYLPRVYDRWLKDPRGAFLVAELDGWPVGTDKITVLSPGEIWLEGLRVDPAAQGQGVARAINRKAMEIIAGLSPRTVRFGTVADNQASRHMGEQDGFRLIFECRRVVAGVQDQKPDSEFIPETAAEPVAVPDGEPAAGMPAEPSSEAHSDLSAAPEDLDAVMRYLKGSENSRRTRGLYAWGWTFQEMSREFVAGILVRRGGLVIRKGGQIEALALFLPQRHGPRSCLGFIDGGQEEMTELARRFRTAAARRGAQGLFAMVPEQAVPALCGAGFRQEYPIEVVVYELSGERLQAAMKKSVGGDRIG